MIFLLLAAALLVFTSVLAAASLRFSSCVAFALAAYLLGWAEMVGLTEMLSLVRGVDTAGYLGAEALVFAVVSTIWIRIGRPMPQIPPIAISRAVRSHPLVVALGVVVGLAVVYEAVVGLSTPSTNIDELWYHLPRAAAWLGHGGLYQIPGGNAPENDYPPNAEIGVLYGFVFLHRDMLATVPQLVAEASLVIVIFGLARRLGSSVAAALFAGLLALTLSDIALESVTALNDIVVASFAGAAAYFILGGRSGAELALAGVAIGLALGTKYTAFFVLPWLFVLAVATLPRTRLAGLLACTILGFAAFGSYGYAENIVHSHSLLGGQAREAGSAPTSITARGTISTMARNTYRFIDFSGYRVKTRWFGPFESFGKDVFRVLHIPIAPPEASSSGSPFLFDFSVGSSPGSSWFGPLGALLVIPLSVGFVVAWALRKVPRTWGLFALCLPLYLLMTALGYRYTSVGRFFITPVVLTLPLAALVYRRRWLAAIVATIGAATLLFALAYDDQKPTGLSGTTVIWQLDRAAAQSLVFGPDVADLIRAVDRLPPYEDLGFDTGQQPLFAYALYGPTLRRRLVPISRQNPIADAQRLGLRAIYTGSDIGASNHRGWTAERFAGAGTLLIKR